MSTLLSLFLFLFHVAFLLLIVPVFDAAAKERRAKERAQAALGAGGMSIGGNDDDERICIFLRMVTYYFVISMIASYIIYVKICMDIQSNVCQRWHDCAN